MSKQRKPISWKRRWRIYQKGNGRCHICGEPLDFTECSIDHVIPLSAGGSDDDDNLMPAHLPCNISKGGVCAPRVKTGPRHGDKSAITRLSAILNQERMAYSSIAAMAADAGVPYDALYALLKGVRVESINLNMLMALIHRFPTISDIFVAAASDEATA